MDAQCMGKRFIYIETWQNDKTSLAFDEYITITRIVTYYEIDLDRIFYVI